MLTATEIKDGIDKAVKKHENDAPDVSSQWALVKAMQDLWPDLPVKVRKANRYYVCAYLVDKSSTKDMTQAQIEALLDWVTRRNVGGDTSPVLGEATRVLDAVNVSAGQGELMPSECAECERLRVAYVVAADNARRDILFTDDDSLYAIRDDAMNDLDAHRKTCQTWRDNGILVQEERCAACDDFAEMLTRLPVYSPVSPILESAIAHRKTCAVWKAAHPKRTEADRLKELGY